MYPSLFFPATPTARKLRLLKSKTLIVAFAVAVVCISVPTPSRAAAVRTVAFSGQPALGLPSGITFGSFSVGGSGGNTIGVALNDAGQTAFRATLSGNVDATNNQAIFSEGRGSLGLVARTGDQAPGMPSGVLYGSVSGSTIRLNDVGQSAFVATLTGVGVSASNDQSIWSDRSGSLSLVSREGDPAPGAPVGVRLGAITSPLSFCQNNVGRIAFSALDSTNTSSLWAEGAGGLELVARSGSQAPGAPTGVNFNGVGEQQNFNDAGQTAFQAGLTGINNRGIFADASGSLRAVALRDGAAPGTSAGVTFISFTASTDLNNAGQVSFAANIFGTGVVSGTNSQGIWSEGSGSLALVVRAGDHAPGTASGVNFSTAFNFWDPVLNDAGQIAFIDNLSDGSGSFVGSGIWSGSSGNLALIARDGNQAPGTALGTNFASFRNSHVLNRVGQVALLAVLTNGKEGLWATDRHGVLQHIICEGDLLEVAPGDFRTVQDFGFLGETGNGDGRPSGFNNFGQLAFTASFTDGTSGAFVSNAVALLPGDLDLNHDVNASDISAMMAALANLSGYQLTNDLTAQQLLRISDLTGDKLVTNFDLQGLIVDLANSGAGSGGGTLTAVPEPATISLLVLGASTALPLARRRRPYEFVPHRRPLRVLRGSPRSPNLSP